MIKFKTVGGGKVVHFPFTIFTLQVAAQVALLLAAFRYGLPGLWQKQMASGWPGVLGAFLLVHLFACFFEYFFHRYILHTIFVYPLQPFARKHRVHHALTKVVRTSPKDGGLRLVENRYPLVEEEQLQSAVFPAYALVAFWAVFTPMLIVFQWLLPSLPMLIGGYIAIAWSYYLYEVWHAVEHLSYEDWWQPMLEHPRWGGLWRRIYGFHLLHHAVPQCNEAISGFFALPVGDWLLKTHKPAHSLPLDGSIADAEDFSPPTPCRLVAWLDRHAARREARWRERHQRMYSSAR